MTIEEIIKNNNLDSNGLQLTKKKGFLTSTWVLFFEEGFYYYFDVCENFDFNEQHKYTIDELKRELGNSQFEVDTDVF
jgi:hypothetical protein